MILGPHVSSTGFLTVIAMIAFAANSLLCRMALGAGLIDASSFATIRVVAGAVILMLLALPRWRIRGREKADVIAVATEQHRRGVAKALIDHVVAELRRGAQQELEEIAEAVL